MKVESTTSYPSRGLAKIKDKKSNQLPSFRNKTLMPSKQ